MRGGENFDNQVCDPVMRLVVTRHDKATPLIFKGVVDRKSGVSAVTVMREVWGLLAIS